MCTLLGVMGIADIITDKELKNFIESDVSDSFNLSIDTIAKKAKGYGRFEAWLNNDTSRIKEVLQAVKNSGVSPAFFASYEKTEGYNSQWGWLNHTSPNGNPVNDAKSVSNWIVDQSNNTSDNPAWIDYANYNDFVPEDVKAEGNKHFANLPTGTIGRVVIAGTAAATWEVYYPKGLKKEYNGVQDYGKPITNMKDTIKEWGGNIEGGGAYFIFPVHEPRRITQEFKGANHWGIDIAGETPGDQPDIHAIADGTVSRSYVSDSYGEAIFIKHHENGKDWESVYGHMSPGSRKFSEGDTVKQDDVIGVMGNTGQSEGVHLHFELHQPTWNGEKSNAVDPLDYLGKGVPDEPDEPPKNDNKQQKYVKLLLCDAVNGWKIF